jgi:hypothetical protein
MASGLRRLFFVGCARGRHIASVCLGRAKLLVGAARPGGGGLKRVPSARYGVMRPIDPDS